MPSPPVPSSMDVCDLGGGWVRRDHMRCYESLGQEEQHTTGYVRTLLKDEHVQELEEELK